MNKTRLIASLFVLSFSSATLQAQDIHFSQAHESPLFMSPANTGFFNGYVRATANYRNQWAAMNNAFQTMALQVDGGLFKSRKRPAFMGIGMTIFRDQAGEAQLNKTTALLNVSGLLKLGNNSAISVGLAGGTAATNANYQKLTYESQFNGNYMDPAVNSGEAIYRQYTTVDVAAGVAYEFADYKRDSDHDDVTAFRIAIGAFHLNRPAEEFGPGSGYRLPIRWSGAVTSILDLEDTRFTLTPSVFYQRQATAQQLLVGTHIKFRMSTGTKVTGEKTQNAIGFGIYNRWKDALIPMLSFDFGDYSAGLSYDINLSGYRTASRYKGGFEVSLRYNLLASSLFESKREFR